MSKKSAKKAGLAQQTTKDPALRYKPYFTVNKLYFTGGETRAFVNRCMFDMGLPAIEDQDTMMIPLSALKTMLSPDMAVEINGDEISVTYKDRTVKMKAGSTDMSLENGDMCSMELPPRYIDGELYIAVESLMHDGYGKWAGWSEVLVTHDFFLGIGDSEQDVFPSKKIQKPVIGEVQFWKQESPGDLKIQLEKNIGVVRSSYYFKEGNRVMPYILYVPTTYDSSRPTKLVLMLHGAGDGAENMRDFYYVPNKIETLSEKYNFITLLSDGYTMGGMYGAYTPEMDPENCPEDERKYIQLGEHEPLEVLKEVKRLYNVDDNNVFIMGNSMGGAGSFYIAYKHPELFRAVAVCGAMQYLNLDKFDVSEWKKRNIPIMFFFGTENGGLLRVKGMAEAMQKQGVEAETAILPGGVHGNAWAISLDNMYDFFNRHSK